MNIQLNNIIWRTEQHLSSSQKILLLCFAYFMGKSGECFPSVKTIAKSTSLAESSVYRLIEGLEEMGAIEVTRSTRRRSNHYKVNVKFLQGKPSSNNPVEDWEEDWTDDLLP